jgi:hypothetical protein
VITEYPTSGTPSGASGVFSDQTLTMNFDLGIGAPAVFGIYLRNASGSLGEPFSKEISAVVPPKTFTMTWTNFPNLGEVTVLPELSTPPGGSGLTLCAQWTAVNTAP